jgi:DNA-binding Lrp family transcriptional regulator
MKMADTNDQGMDEIDRRIVTATQAGLPLCRRPYHAVADQLGLTAEEVMRRMTHMQQAKVIRRIAAVPNHYALGYRKNGMTVWDVADGAVDQLGPKVGALSFVSHCYLRPRHLPDWPYNLFAMVHARDEHDVEKMVSEIAALLGDACSAHETLFSTQILKKTGLRIASA